MSVLNKKDRMVSFRLSRAEFAAAELSCARRGVRSVSTLARDAVVGITAADQESNSPSHTEILLHLQHQFMALREDVDSLAGLLGRINAPAAPRYGIPHDNPQGLLETAAGNEL